jgi:hypothetical protein
MAEQTHQQDVETRDPEVAGVGVQPGAAPGAAASAHRRPYASPELRYLGKVADLTFGGLGSITDGGTHTGHNQKV